MSKRLNKLFATRFLTIFVSILMILSLFVLIKGDSKSEIIDENDVEDIDLFIGPAFSGQSNVMLMMDMSQSMGDHFAGAQIGNWDQQTPIAECETEQNVSSTDEIVRVATAHCMENAAGINGFLLNNTGKILDSDFMVAGDSGNDPVIRGCGTIACGNSINGTCILEDEFNAFLECIDRLFDASVVNSVFANALETHCFQTDTGNKDTNKSLLKSKCEDEERVAAAAAMDNYEFDKLIKKGVKKCLRKPCQLADILSGIES